MILTTRRIALKIISLVSSIFELLACTTWVGLYRSSVRAQTTPCRRFPCGKHAEHASMAARWQCLWRWPWIGVTAAAAAVIRTSRVYFYRFASDYTQRIPLLRLYWRLERTWNHRRRGYLLSPSLEHVKNIKYTINIRTYNRNNYRNAIIII